MSGLGMDGSRGWAAGLWESLADGGFYGIPRCGLVFRKNELAKQLTLIERMPWDPAMPVTAEQLHEAQEDDLQGMVMVMAGIGVTVLALEI
jgi:hypothetical protein